MFHRDSSGAEFPLTPKHLSVMNAGNGISHEEGVPETGEPVELLQIFIRPREDNLEPGIQHHEFSEAKSRNDWRLLLGPEDSDAPLKARNATWIYDAHLSGTTLALVESNDIARLLYVFKGEVIVGENRIEAGDSMLFVNENNVRVISESSAEVVLFLVDQGAAASRSGTLSGAK